MTESFEFFIDRSLGRHQVPQALREAGLTVYTMAEVYVEQAGQRLKDEVWLEEVGRRGWVVLMKDDAIRRRPAEREALIAGAVRAFCLTNAQLRGAGAYSHGWWKEIPNDSSFRALTRRASRERSPWTYPKRTS